MRNLVLHGDLISSISNENKNLQKKSVLVYALLFLLEQNFLFCQN
jgi:hypothetical protein